MSLLTLLNAPEATGPPAGAVAQPGLLAIMLGASAPSEGVSGGIGIPPMFFMGAEAGGAQLHERTGAETLPEPGDIATASFILAIREVGETLPAVGDEATVYVGQFRTGEETLPAITDVVASYVTGGRTGVESLPEPTDVATAVVRKLYVRHGVEVLPPVQDRVTSLTRLAAYVQPSSYRPTLKRVVYPSRQSAATRAPMWSSDVPVSQPQPYDERMPVLVDMGGFGFTAGGLCVNISEADTETHFSPHFAPQGVEP